MQSKTEPASARIKKLLKVLVAYSFNHYYMKGKYVTLSDLLSGIKVAKYNPYEIIPISFDLKSVRGKMLYAC